MTPSSERGELHLDLVAPVGGEDVDDAVERLGGVVGVQGGEDEVAGLGDGQRGRDALEVAHLADEQDVGVLTKSRAQCAVERTGVGADLALADRRAVVAVDVLDRVLDGDDVAGPVAVDVVEHRGQRRRLPRTGRSGDDDEAHGQVDEALDGRRDPELVEARGSRRG